MISNDIQYKNVFSQSWWAGKQFIISNRSIWSIHKTPADTTPLDQSGPVSNSNEGLISVGYHPPFSTQWTSPSAIYSSCY